MRFTQVCTAPNISQIFAKYLAALHLGLKTMLGHVGQNGAIGDLEQFVIVGAAGGAESLGKRSALAFPINRGQEFPQRMRRPAGTGFIVSIGQRQTKPFRGGIAP